ncbi:EthD family reductase [Chiayiivirga flava]|uniref:Uncharacterized protein (TIGR02118 family) n=1 Tax=Chiayiivirga flava TaxID=659595 RepID=A0A7W8FZC3_9GAMM|nr:EthD family reductase [Chiayiivirga flava]MBB5207996.1 uncharacterized protein (TIGR02118 family) [Chiayiivirga flava]
MSSGVGAIKRVKVVGIYRWAADAWFDHDYYTTEHARLAGQLLQPLGMIRFECSRALIDGPPTAGAVIATSNAYFSTLAQARTAVLAAGALLAADLPNYSGLRPELQFHEVCVSTWGDA